MLEYRVSARRLDAHGSEATAKQATLTLDTGVQGRPDAFNPAELLLAALAACMIKGIERVAPMIHFHVDGVEVRLHGIRQDAPPMMAEAGSDGIGCDRPACHARLSSRPSQSRGSVMMSGRIW